MWSDPHFRKGIVLGGALAHIVALPIFFIFLMATDQWGWALCLIPIWCLVVYMYCEARKW